jgi:hypothetical protein
VNTRFNYMYRDGSNNKEHGDVIFAGEAAPGDLERLTGQFDEGLYFKADKVGVPDLLEACWSVIDELDHGWHEFCGLEPTDVPPTDPRPFSEFLAGVISITSWE